MIKLIVYRLCAECAGGSGEESFEEEAQEQGGEGEGQGEGAAPQRSWRPRRLRARVMLAAGLRKDKAFKRNLGRVDRCCCWHHWRVQPGPSALERKASLGHALALDCARRLRILDDDMVKSARARCGPGGKPAAGSLGGALGHGRMHVDRAVSGSKTLLAMVYHAVADERALDELVVRLFDLGAPKA